ncbi:hypothetical protein YC2023_101599 [Brassica napus]
MLVDPTCRMGELDCSFGPTRPFGELDDLLDPTRPFGELDGAGGLWFEELVSGHCLHGGRVASWFGQPPVHGGPLSSRVSDSFVLVWVGEADGLVVSWFVLVGPDVPALVTITYFLLEFVQVWFVVRLLDVVLLREHLLSLPRSCVFLVGLLASQWFRPSVLLLRGGGHFSVGRWLSLGCEGPRVRIGGLGRRFPGQSSSFCLCSLLCCNYLGRLESGGVLGVHSPLCSSVVLLELLSFSSVGDVQMV